jgi:hypothetical protein
VGVGECKRDFKYFSQFERGSNYLYNNSFCDDEIKEIVTIVGSIIDSFCS